MVGYAPRGAPPYGLAGAGLMDPLRTLLSPDEPGWTYGSVLPFRSRGTLPAQHGGGDIEMQWAWPGMAKDIAQGTVGLARGAAGERGPIDETDPLSVGTGGLMNRQMEVPLLAYGLRGIGARGDPNVVSAMGRGGRRLPPMRPRPAAPEGEAIAPPPMGHNMPPEEMTPEPPRAEATAPDVGPAGAGTPERAPPKTVRQEIEAAVAEQAKEGEAPKAPRRAITSINLRNMQPEEATAIARRGEHLIQDKTGQYVGAPRGIDTPEKLQAMRDAFDAIAARGIPGRYWYPRSRAAVTEITGGDPQRSRLAAAEMGLWSPQSTPPTNFGFATTGHNAFEATGQVPDIVRTGQQAETYREAREAGELPRLAKKTGPFALHLDPTQVSPTTSVNDIWHARAFGYTDRDGSVFDRALTAQEHAFLDAETLLAADRANQQQLGGFSDWGSGNVQASAWVGAKAKQLVEEKGYTWEEALEEAKVDFADVLDKHTAAATYRQAPGAAPWETAQGEDPLYRSTGFYQRPPIKTAEGVTARPIIDYVPGETGPEPSPVSRGTLNAVEALRSYLDAPQQPGGWHKLLTSGKAGAMGAVDIPYERPLAPGEMAQLRSAVQPYGLSPSDTGQGVSLLSAGKGPSPKDMPKALSGELGGAIRGALPDTTPVRARQFGETPLTGKGGKSLMAPEAKQGTGAATRGLFKALDNPAIPAIGGKLDTPELRQMALTRLQEAEAGAARTGSPLRQDIQNARRIISESGLTGLRAALKAGKIPLPAVAALIGLGLGVEAMPGRAQAAEQPQRSYGLAGAGLMRGQ